MKSSCKKTNISIFLCVFNYLNLYKIKLFLLHIKLFNLKEVWWIKNWYRIVDDDEKLLFDVRIQEHKTVIIKLRSIMKNSKMTKKKKLTLIEKVWCQYYNLHLGIVSIILSRSVKSCVIEQDLGKNGQLYLLRLVFGLVFDIFCSYFPLVHLL